MQVHLQRCVSLDNSETGRSLIAKSNHRIYRKELTSDWNRNGEAVPTLVKGSFAAMKQFCAGNNKQEMQKLCQKEFDILNDCNNENIVTVLGLCLEVEENNPESWPVFFMELGECSLQYALTVKQAGTDEFLYPTGDQCYSRKHCLSWLLQIANAMAYLHGKVEPVVHRDLKSSNVLLFEGKTKCKICDFDMSRYYNPEGMTVNIGSWRWMAPEVRTLASGNSKQSYDLKVDCYSFGVLICESVFRQNPFSYYQNDCVFYELGKIPEMLELEDAMIAMTLRQDENRTQVKLNRDCSVFPFSERLWNLVDELLAWDPVCRPDFNAIVSRLAIEAPLAQLHVEDKAGGALSALPPIVSPMNVASSDNSIITDTGMLPNWICPSVPSVRRTVKLLYYVELPDGGDITSSEKDRIIDKLKTHSDDVVSFYEDEHVSRQSDHQARDGDSLDITSHFRFTENGCLQHEICCADPVSRNNVAKVCGSSADLLVWMAGLFKRDRCKRLRKIEFQVAADEVASEPRRCQ